VRTLVVSDLHIGLRSGRDRLRDERVRAVLLESLADYDRLVLLGDTIELRQEPLRDVLAVAAPMLREIGEAMGAGRQVVLVPGNHDHHLLHAWFERNSRDAAPPPLGCEREIDWRIGEPLARVVQALGPVDVAARYPGIRLRHDVYATHGHYADRHTTIPMFERLAAGAMARLLDAPAAKAGSAEDYEAVLGPVYAWLHTVAQGGGPALHRGGGASSGPSARIWKELKSGVRRGGWRRHALRFSFPLAIATFNRLGLGPLRGDIDGASIRRAPLLAIGEVLRCLEIEADHVIFGHTHRAGPQPGDAASEWTSSSGCQLINCGSWVHEPAFVGQDPASPYRAGFAVSVEGRQPPQLVNLLDRAASANGRGGLPPGFAAQASPGTKHVA
jgi:predicted phosphodiesterase